MIIKILRFFLVIACFAFSSAATGQAALIDSIIQDPNSIIEDQVIDSHPFFGLAGYYNTATFKLVRKDKVMEVGDEFVTLGPDDWITIIGRFNVLAIQSEGLTLRISDKKKIHFSNPSLLLENDTRVELAEKPELKSIAPELNKIRYSHLILPIRILARALEAIIILIQKIVGNWGLSIIGISIFIKLMMLPLANIVKRYQDQVSRTQANLAPKLSEIKSNLKGEAAHKAFMQAHKDEGVSTFYTLKPMIGLVIQVPVWIAIFNVLAEMPQISGHSFLWIKDLAYPDAVLNWGAPIPLIGNTLNLMPLLMTAVTIVSTIYFRDSHAPKEVLRSQKRNLFFMAIAFLILFYPFPSGMVFYWTLANLLNAIQQIISQRRQA